MILISINLSKLCHIVQNRLDSFKWSIILDVIDMTQKMQNQNSNIKWSCVYFDIIFVKNISSSLNLSTKVFIISMFHLLCQYVIFEETLYLFTNAFLKYHIRIFIVKSILLSIIQCFSVFKITYSNDCKKFIIIQNFFQFWKIK